MLTMIGHGYIRANVCAACKDDLRGREGVYHERLARQEHTTAHGRTYASTWPEPICCKCAHCTHIDPAEYNHKEDKIMATVATEKKADPRITLKDLQDAGVLPDGAEIKANAKKREYTAYIKDGAIHIDGFDGTFPSPSAAGMAVREGKATNGWSFWKYGDHELGDLRKQIERPVATTEDEDVGDGNEEEESEDASVELD